MRVPKNQEMRMPLVTGKDGLPEWQDWSAEQFQQYLREGFERTHAKSMDTKSVNTKVNLASLLTIVMLLGLLWLKKSAWPERSFYGWEIEIDRFLSTASIYGETGAGQS
jgi:hypothetical protein